MTPSYVKVTDLHVGLPVEYLGESDPVPVLDEKLQAIGLALYWAPHRGRVQPQGTRPSGPPRKRENPVRLGSAVVMRRPAAMICRRPGPCLQKAAIQWEIMVPEA
jgi:hypothetical protein